MPPTTSTPAPSTIRNRLNEQKKKQANEIQYAIDQKIKSQKGTENRRKRKAAIKAAKIASDALAVAALTELATTVEVAVDPVLGGHVPTSAPVLTIPLGTDNVNVLTGPAAVDVAAYSVLGGHVPTSTPASTIPIGTAHDVTDAAIASITASITAFQSVVENSMASLNANMTTLADTVAASIAASGDEAMASLNANMTTLADTLAASIAASGDAAVAAINAAATAAVTEAVTKITEATVAVGDNTPAHGAGGKDAAVGVKLASDSYFCEQGCKFSDPTGIGARLPLIVVEIMAPLWKSNVAAKQMATDDPVTTIATDDPVTTIEYNHLRVILPPSSPRDTLPCIIVFLLYQFGIYLGQNKIRTSIRSLDYGLVEYDTSHYSGLREINGHRYEIFMKDNTRTHNSIHTLFRKMLQSLAPHSVDFKDDLDFIVIQMRKCVIEFCNAMAMRDDRIANAITPYKFQNHAIIASYGKVQPQDVHIDLDTREEYQFGILLSDKSSPTCEYKATMHVLSENGSLSEIWPDINLDLDELLRSDEEIQDHLNAYGSVLSNPEQVKRKLTANVGAGGVKKKQKLPTEHKLPIGTLISLPGKVAHGGPFSDGFRAVLFFTGVHEDRNGYNSDKQANRTMLVSNMLVKFFVELTQEQRLYLLNKWHDECLVKDKFGVDNLVHLHVKALGGYLKREKNRDKRKKVMTEFSEFEWTDKNWEDSYNLDRFEVPGHEYLTKEEEEMKLQSK